MGKTEQHVRPVLVVMGVAGSGKTAFGEKLAKALGFRFIEGDRFHPPRNIALMAAGTPLGDADRAEWLDAIGQEIAKASSAGEPVVVACSALKRAYRDRLRAFNPDILFLYLDIDRHTAARRVASRRHHFMPPSLVESQFAILEPPGENERAVSFDASQPVASLLHQARKLLQ